MQCPPLAISLAAKERQKGVASIEGGRGRNNFRARLYQLPPPQTSTSSYPYDTECQ